MLLLEASGVVLGLFAISAPLILWQLSGITNISKHKVYHTIQAVIDTMLLTGMLLAAAPQ